MSIGQSSFQVGDQRPCSDSTFDWHHFGDLLLEGYCHITMNSSLNFGYLSFFDLIIKTLQCTYILCLKQLRYLWTKSSVFSINIRGDFSTTFYKVSYHIEISAHENVDKVSMQKL